MYPALQYSLENARIDNENPDYALWVEEGYCSPPYFLLLGIIEPKIIYEFKHFYSAKSILLKLIKETFEYF
jgi:hypothetical protein